jgi:hypothetical protein
MLRRLGIAIGSLVAGMLCVGLVSGLAMGFLGMPSSTMTWSIATIAGIVLGGLVYRDIMRREAKRA